MSKAKELEEAKKWITERVTYIAENCDLSNKNNKRAYDSLSAVLNYIDNSISKEVVEEKIEELNNGIKRDMINYDKVQDENWKKAIHHSMHNKIDTKNALQELLEGK